MPSGTEGTSTIALAWFLARAFSSQVATSPDAAAHVLWGIATVPPRTAGRLTYVYTITINNHSGNAGTVDLQVAGVNVYPQIPCPGAEEVVINLESPIVVGNNDLNYVASQANIDVQVEGVQM